MWSRLFSTKPDPGALIARLTLGVIIFPHGAQHALGWFGGYGFGGTFAWMTGTLGFPAVLAAPAIIIELVAPCLLVAGLAGRIAAAGIAAIMIGATMTHLPNGFFMNWFGSLPAGAEGFEYHILAFALAAIVVVKGSGAISMDRRLFARHEPDGAPFKRNPLSRAA